MRALFTLLAALTLLLLQSALVQLLPGGLPAPAFGTLVALHLGLSSRWSLSGQVLTGFFTGYLFDLLSGAPPGTHALVYALIALFVGRLARRIALAGFLPRLAISFAVGLLAALAVVAIRATVGPSGGLGGLRWAPIEAAITALLGPLVLSLLERIDGATVAKRTPGGLHRRRRRTLGNGQLPLG